MISKEFFKKIYNCTPEGFNWKEDSWELCYYHSEYFLLWWDPEKFNWEDINYLKKYCSKYKHIWELDYLLRKII